MPESFGSSRWNCRKNFSASSRKTGQATFVAQRVLRLEVVQLAQRGVSQVLGADVQVHDHVLHMVVQLLNHCLALGLVLEHRHELVVELHHVYQVLLVQTPQRLARLLQQLRRRRLFLGALCRRLRLDQHSPGHVQLGRLGRKRIAEQNDSVQTLEPGQFVDEPRLLLSARKVHFEVSGQRT